MIDPKEIRREAGPRTKALIVTHLWGVPAEMDEILEVAEEKNLIVIEMLSRSRRNLQGQEGLEHRPHGLLQSLQP